MHKPTFSVTVEGHPHTAVVEQGDITRWEMERHTKQWPQMDEAPNLYMTFVCWSALRRQGDVPKDMPFDYFVDAMTDLTIEDAVPVDPTPQAPTPALSSS